MTQAFVAQAPLAADTLTVGDRVPMRVNRKGELLTAGANGGFTSTAVFTPAAAAYAAGDIMEGAKAFANLGPAAGGDVLITNARFRVDTSALQASEAAYTLHLYNVTPPSALADNAAWDLPSGDRSSYLGSISLGTPVDVGSTLWIETTGINKQITVPSGGSVYGYLVTAAGFTATAAARNVTLKALAA